jgi:hypothetical protein
MLERSGLAKARPDMDDVIDHIQLNMSVEPVLTDDLGIRLRVRRSLAKVAPFPGFYVNYTASSAREAQQDLCNELTSLLLEEESEVARRMQPERYDGLSQQAGGRQPRTHILTIWIANLRRSRSSIWDSFPATRTIISKF